MIATWSGFRFSRTPGALGKTIFIYQGLTPGNIDVHPKASFNRKTIQDQVNRFRLDLYG
jgi:hypothetical protein